MNKIVVTGVTGQLGRQTVKYLMEKGVSANQIRGVARNPQRAAGLISELGIEVVQGDYDDTPSLVKAFEGASKLLFISAPSYDNTLRIRQHASVVEAARNAGVGHIIYTGIAFPEKMKLGLENVHLATEYMIRTTNLPYTFLRNAFYLEILVNEGLRGIVASGELVTSAPTGRMNYVARNDLALAAAIVLSSDSHENRIYELANPQPFNFDEFAILLSELAGKPVKHRVVTPQEAMNLMVQAGVAEGGAAFMVHGVYSAIEEGQFSFVSDDLVKLIGSAYTAPAQAIRQALHI
jgi:NAD(P)H dehydrogenase (quinone)